MTTSKNSQACRECKKTFFVTERNPDPTDDLSELQQIMIDDRLHPSPYKEKTIPITSFQVLSHTEKGITTRAWLEKILTVLGIKPGGKDCNSCAASMRETYENLPNPDQERIIHRAKWKQWTADLLKR